MDGAAGRRNGGILGPRNARRAAVVHLVVASFLVVVALSYLAEGGTLVGGTVLGFAAAGVLLLARRAWRSRS